MNSIGAAKTPKEPAYDKWQAEEDMRCVMRAKEIEKDPKRMANVRRAAKEKLAEMKQMEALAAGKT